MYRGWWIVLTAFLTQFASTGASGWVFGVLVLPMEAGLDVSRSTIVGVLLVERLVGGIFGAWLGPLVDRHGARVLTTLSAVVAGACLLLLSQVQAAWQPYVIWAVFGLTLPGLSTVAPVASVSAWFVRRRTQAIVAYTFGGAAAGLVLAPIAAIVSAELGWRTVWVLMGLLFWAIAPLAWTAIRRRPEDVGLMPDGLDRAPAGPTAQTTPLAAADAESWTVAQALRSRSFWLLTAGFTLTMLPASSIFIHMAAFVHSKGFTLEQGAAAVSIYGFGAVAGRLVWGIAVARGGLHRSLVAWGLAYGASILLYVVPTSLLVIYGATILLGVTVAGSLQFRAQTFPDYFGRRIVGSLVGYSSAIGTLAGAAAPLLVAFAFDQTGSYTAIFVLWGLCCLAASIGFALSRPRSAPRLEPA